MDTSAFARLKVPVGMLDQIIYWLVSLAGSCCLYLPMVSSQTGLLARGPDMQSGKLETARTVLPIAHAVRQAERMGDLAMATLDKAEVHTV